MDAGRTTIKAALVLSLTVVLFLALDYGRAFSALTYGLVSATPDGAPGDSGSWRPALSGTGRYVLFESGAHNLAAGDDNSDDDVYVRDRSTGQVSRVSVSAAGEGGDSGSHWPAVGPDGRYVVFSSTASNLVVGDTNGLMDVFLKDMQTGAVERANLSSAEEQTTSGQSNLPAVSVDGHYVLFWSAATNLVPDDANGTGDVFVRDRQLGTTERVSLDWSGEEAAAGAFLPLTPTRSLSSDGRFVLLGSNSTLLEEDDNLFADLYRYDRQSDVLELMSVSPEAEPGDHPTADGGGLSSDGRYLVFSSTAANLVADDTNGFGDVFVRDASSHTTQRVSLSSAGD